MDTNIKNAILSKDIIGIREIVNQKPIADIIGTFENLNINEKSFFFRVLDTEKQGELFSNLNSDSQKELIDSFSDGQLGNLVNELHSADVADLIEEMPSNIASRILSKTDIKTRAHVNQILKYDNDEVGSIMYVDIVTLKSFYTIKESINIIKKAHDFAKMSRNFFVVDRQNVCIGSIQIEDLIFYKDDSKISEILTPTPTLLVNTSKEDAALTFAKYDMDSLPVVSHKMALVGLVTADEMIDVIQEVATEDAEKMAGITKSDVTSNYLKAKPFAIFKSRIFWLCLLLMSATLSQIVLDSFQTLSNNLLASSAIWTTAIVAIIPVVSSTAGNAGSQVSTTIIRGLALGKIQTKDYLKIVFKELRVSFLIGITLGVINFLRLLSYYAARGDFLIGVEGHMNFLFLSLAASISLFIVIFLAKLFGGILPLFAKLVKIDPAVMATPILSTIIDVISTLIFFSISIGVMYLVLM